MQRSYGAWAWLGGIALILSSCSKDEEPASTSQATASGSGGSPATGGAAGEGGSDVAPVIESLTTDVGVVTSWDTVVTFSAIVTDPQNDVVGGDLSSGVSYGAFEATGTAGTYELQLTIDESGSWPDGGYKVFLAVFRDRAGHSAERTAVVHFDIGGCTQKPDHEACRACFCAADPVGCEAYTTREYQYLYCGSACSQDCSAFCDTFNANAPDPQLIQGFCKACQPSQADVAAFQDSCLADVPVCFGFLVDVGQCPP